MSMKLSRKFVIGVVINLPKYFASHFGHVTLKQLITSISLTQKWGIFIKLKTFDINTLSTAVPTECRLLMWYSYLPFKIFGCLSCHVTYFPQLFIALNMWT